MKLDKSRLKGFCRIPWVVVRSDSLRSKFWRIYSEHAARYQGLLSETAPTNCEIVQIVDEHTVFFNSMLTLMVSAYFDSGLIRNIFNKICAPTQRIGSRFLKYSSQKLVAPSWTFFGEERHSWKGCWIKSKVLKPSFVEELLNHNTMCITNRDHPR